MLLHCSRKGLKILTQRSRTSELLNLPTHFETRTEKYAHFPGYETEVGIAQVLLNDPEDTGPDEPTAGLDLKERASQKYDPQAFQRIRSLFIHPHQMWIYRDRIRLAKRKVYYERYRIELTETIDGVGSLEWGRGKEKLKIWMQHMRGKFPSLGNPRLCVWSIKYTKTHVSAVKAEPTLEDLYLKSFLWRKWTRGETAVGSVLVRYEWCNMGSRDEPATAGWAAACFAVLCMRSVIQQDFRHRWKNGNSV